MNTHNPDEYSILRKISEEGYELKKADMYVYFRSYRGTIKDNDSTLQYIC